MNKSFFVYAIKMAQGNIVGIVSKEAQNRSWLVSTLQWKTSPVVFVHHHKTNYQSVVSTAIMRVLIWNKYCPLSCLFLCWPIHL